MLLFKYPGFLGVFCFLLFWFIVCRWRLVGSTLIASPQEVYRVVADSARSRLPPEDNLFTQTFATIGRILLGWSLSLGIGITLGAIFGLVSAVYKIIEPLVEFFRSIPPVMVFPLLLVMFNYSEKAYVSTIAFGCIPLVILTVVRGFQQMSYIRLELLKTFQVSNKVRLLAAFMEILPSFVLAARLAFSISIIIAVVSEMVFTPRNGRAIGSLAKNAEIAFQTPVFISALLIIGLFGYAGNFGIRKLEERLGAENLNGL